jgi:hypothetical protein
VDDMLGRTVKQGKISRVKGEVSVNFGKNIVKGIYFLKVKTPNTCGTFKLIKLF